MKTSYRGSCHCGKVRYEASIDLSKGTNRCNCSFCAKTRRWSVMVDPEDFRLVSDDNDLGDYQFSPESPNHHLFCKHCGVQVFTRGFVEEIGGHFVSLSIATIDNVADRDLADLPIQFMDGRNDAWHSPPAETRHL